MTYTEVVQQHIKQHERLLQAKLHTNVKGVLCLHHPRPKQELVENRGLTISEFASFLRLFLTALGFAVFATLLELLTKRFFGK